MNYEKKVKTLIKMVIEYYKITLEDKKNVVTKK